jgi:2-polyprenyl-3-methyl-5-hydroxy-6-metoxy-1,4-benzoquinol methylase
VVEMSESVVEYYTEHYNEALRHRDDAFGIIQEIRTKELISRYLGSEKRSILDVGGANGVYSFYLAECGHEVSLLDIVPEHIEQAKRINDEKTVKIQNFFSGDARSFETEDRYYMIIIHGPLYHIIDRDERISLLRNMKSLLTKDGVILGFGINRYAGYFYGMRSGKILQEDYRDVVFEEIKSGVRRSGPGWYFHKPEEMKSEFEDAGLEVSDIKSVTTQVWMLPDIDKMIRETESLREILDIAKRSEDEVDIGQDLMCVGRV